MNRRTFVLAAATGLGGTTSVAETVGQRVPHIGIVGYGASSGDLSETTALRRGLRELGWIDGRTVVIDHRWAEGHVERLPLVISELVRARVDVLFVTGTLAMRAASTVSQSVPVVFVVLADPVEAGLVRSLARPGGNLTGLASQFDLLIGKQLQLLKEALPDLSRIAMLTFREPTHLTLSAAQSAARQLGLETQVLRVGEVGEFEEAFRLAQRGRARAMQVLPSPYFDVERRALIELAGRYRMPAIYEFRNYVRDGGLMSYGPSIDEMFHRAARYIDRILKGAYPADLPIERPPRFELVINQKASAALALTFPKAFLLQVDELISRANQGGGMSSVKPRASTDFPGGCGRCPPSTGPAMRPPSCDTMPNMSVRLHLSTQRSPRTA